MEGFKARDQTSVAKEVISEFIHNLHYQQTFDRDQQTQCKISVYGGLFGTTFVLWDIANSIEFSNSNNLQSGLHGNMTHTDCDKSALTLLTNITGLSHVVIVLAPQQLS